MRFRAPLVALVAAATAVTVTPDTASAVWLTDCTVTLSESTIYTTDGGSGRPTTAYADIDVSSSIVLPADYYIHISDDDGNSWTSLMQTSSGSGNTPAWSWYQWIGYATAGTVLELDAALEVTISISSYQTIGGGPSTCFATLTLMPNVAPSAPTDVTGSAGDGSATVSWTPAKNFAGQTFTVTSSPDGKTCSVEYPATSCTVEGLTNGTAYTFAVTTTTSGGTSDASADSAPVTPTAGDDGDLPTDGGDPELPATGAPTVSLIVASLLSIACGALLLRTRRRRTV